MSFGWQEQLLPDLATEGCQGAWFLILGIHLETNIQGLGVLIVTGGEDRGLHPKDLKETSWQGWADSGHRWEHTSA